MMKQMMNFTYHTVPSIVANYGTKVSGDTLSGILYVQIDEAYDELHLPHCPVH